MTPDIRNAFGYPVMLRLESAKEYAATAKERNQPPCNCPTCQHIEKLPQVIQLTQRWK